MLKMKNSVIITLAHVSKKFPGVVALDDINLEIHKGEVHCLVGENGAGKSTLIKILTGANTLEEGEIYINGEKVKINRPQDAIDNGIAVVYQELTVLQNLTVTDNLMLGCEYAYGGWINRSKNKAETKKYLAAIDLVVEPETMVRMLSPANQQMVEIAKAISLNAKVIIFDEPTAMLSEKETITLFQLIRMLKDKDVTIIYISHRMKEIFELGDRVSVLKDGKLVTTMNVSDTDEESLVTKMIGRELTDIYPKKTNTIGKPILEVKSICTDMIKDISFVLHEGEVLGLAGLVGSGRTEVLRTIFGADKIRSGQIVYAGKTIKCASCQSAVKNKIALVPENRRMQGVIGKLSVKDNIALIYSTLIANFGWRNRKKESNRVKEFIDSLEIKTPTDAQLVGNLSGGNQQKVVLAKWLSIGPKILLLDEPTQGIDIGVKSDIYNLINDFANQGLAIILVSSEMIEVLNLSDNVIVMRNGKIAGTMSAADADEEKVIKMAMGVI